MSNIFFIQFNGAQGEIRTHTPQVITAFEAAASTIPPLVHIRILGIISLINKPRQRHPLFFLFCKVV